MRPAPICDLGDYISRGLALAREDLVSIEVCPGPNEIRSALERKVTQSGGHARCRDPAANC